MTKISFKKDTIIKILGMAETVVSKNSSLPSLSNVLIKKEDNKISFLASDLDIGISLSTPIKTGKKKEEPFLVDPRTFIGVVSHAPATNLDLEKKDNSFVVKQKDYSSEIPTIEGSDFPPMPSPQGKGFDISAKDLLSSFSQVDNSLARLETKPELTGVLFTITKNEIVLVSTDGFRLAEKQISKKQASLKEDLSCIIPAKTIGVVSKVFQVDGDDIKISIEEGQIFFSGTSGTMDVCVVSSVIDGSYPDYKNVLPKEFVCSMIVEKQDLLERIKGGSVFTDDSNVIKIKVDSKSCVVSVKNTGKGDFETKIPITHNGDENECELNYTYLQDGLGNIEDKKVVVKFSKNNGPLFLQGEKTSNYIYLLMPIRV